MKHTWCVVMAIACVLAPSSAGFGLQVEPVFPMSVPDEVVIDGPASQPCDCPQGNVSECCCTFTDLEESNSKVVHSLLKRIVATPFFAHFKIDLCTGCRLWEDQPLCSLRDCSVCECEKPPTWAAEAASDCDSMEMTQIGDRVLPSVNERILNGWAVSEDMTTESGRQVQSIVVDLRENPERYTGYDGESAARVWAALHNESAFQPEDAAAPGLLPAEQRLYDRIVSGLHTSISLHIVHDYCLDRVPEATYECARWGVNLPQARERVLQHPDRVENLYVVFAVLLRAVVRVGDTVTAAVPTNDPEFASGLQEWESGLLPELRRLEISCPKTFDESTFFNGPDATSQRAELDIKLKRLMEIMRCVGCDRCKLWGTMQMLGISTALRVLFPLHPGPIELTRQQAVALVHTLERVASSLGYLREMRSL